jgi:Ca-activated chloride channel family protein
MVVCVVFWATTTTAQDLEADRMELHLVLAFDVSASVNDVEFDLQRTGTANALRAPEVMAAIEHAPGGAAIAIVQWSSVIRQALGLDWVILHTEADVAAYADTVDAMPRRISGGGTMIHSGLNYASRLMDAAPGYARRRVIDLSGNGQTDDLDKMLEVRDWLASRGIVINALAIEEHHNDLTSYFHRYLITGPGSFVVTAAEFEDFHEAMQIKLLREISGAVFSENTSEAWVRMAAKRNADTVE